MTDISIVDIARAAGVSPSTVSRALQDHPRISPERRTAIQALAQSMGYQPCQVARSLVTGRTRTLGVVVTDVTDPFVAEVLTGAEVAARAAGYTLLFATSHRDPEREIEAAEMLAGRQVDGMLAISSRAADHYAELRRRGTAGGAELPVVLVNNDQPGERMHSVRMDNRAGAALAVGYLAGLGHTRIAFLSGPEGGRSSRERLEGYRQGLAQARAEASAAGAGQGAESDVPAGGGQLKDQPAATGAGNMATPIMGAEKYVLPGSGQLEDGPPALAALLALPEPPTAILCYNDLAAIGLLSAAQRAGLRVPVDLSVVGYDNIQLGAYTIPPLTTINQPARRLGHEAVTLCLAALAGEPAADVVLKGELVIRESAAEPRRAA